jgi:hypothetical protein
MGEGGGGVAAGSQPMSTAQSGAQINCGNLTPYLTYASYRILKPEFQFPEFNRLKA